MPAAPSPLASTDVETLGATIARLRRALRRGLRADPRWDQLPMAHVELLLCLGEFPGLKIGEVAAFLRLAPNTVSTLVSQLMARGLLENGRDDVDKRARRLHLTAAGTAQLQGWKAAHDQMLAQAVERMLPAQRAMLLAALPALGSLIDVLDGE